MSAYPEHARPVCPICQRNTIRQRGATKCQACAQTPGWHTRADSPDVTIARPPDSSQTYEWAWAEWQRYIGQAKAHYAGPPDRPLASDRQKIVIASDFHVPFQHRPAVAALFERECDADIAVLAGDLLDFYSISRFLKYETVPVERELAELTLLIEQASQTWPRVLIIEGNHDQPRFMKQLLERLQPEMIKVITFLAGGNLSVISAIAKHYPNVEIVSTQIDHHEVKWFVQLHDVIVAHAEKFSRVPGSAMRAIEEWFSDQEQALNLKPWRVICQAHTHQLSRLPWHADKLLVETGCLCSIHGYQLQAKIGGRPQRRGWVTLEQVNGVVDINTVREHWWDVDVTET